ncbi:MULTISPECIES: YceI family protein [Streptomyces]|uniref:YceI family protein n=1 Tax=Streptomyces TaxID=1883 RepID=UPI0029AA5601|nr:YceI family protein [Streptomyces scabiei]MDX3119719.1 YceI family protein [Streptomyces scabiei]
MTVAVQTGLWNLDAGASTVALKHKTMWNLVTVKGAFTAVSGGGEVGPDGSVTGVLTLDVASLDTKNAKRDAHLRGADFFDADNHPEITFVVRTAELGADATAKISGQLTVRGISRPQSFTARIAGADADAITLEAEFTVDRGEFGLGWNQMGMIRGLTAVTATLRFTRTAA